jgi:hypothetical protein
MKVLNLSILLILPTVFITCGGLANGVISGKYLWLAEFTLVVVIIVASIGMYHLKKDSADGRAFIWKISLQTLVRHPLGVGLGNFSGAYGDEQAAWFTSGKAVTVEETVAGNP